MTGAPRGDRAPPVQVDVLGPLRLTVGEDLVEVPGPKRRALLALLVMAPGAAVPVDDLLDALWPGELPDAGRASLHSHVSRLRRHLGPAAGRLEGLAGAYRLEPGDGAASSDVARARALFAAAGAAAPASARALLGEARALWRGVPLAEFADVAPLAAWGVTLNHLRRAIDEAYAAAVLDAGAPAEAVALASALVAADPLSGSSVLVQMRALDAAGRAAEALRIGHDYRRRLAVETGLEPSPSLAHLERQIAGRAGGARPRVPRPASPLRGRHSELAALQRLVAQERLVTVLGPGGVGKTRLVMELAARAEEVHVLLLAPVTDPGTIAEALAGALELHVLHGDTLAACVALLGAGPQMLVVDNCEHLLSGVRQLIPTILDACPQLTVVATSREPLGLPAEQRFRMAPLPLTTVADDPVRSPAVAVFVDRARRVRPDFTLDADRLRLVAELVRRLDGMPLAIELAAGRLSSLDLGDLHARLDRSLDLLADGAVTLRQTIEWSYELLPEHEQRLFRRLSVYPDGFDLATAESVGAGLGLPVDSAAALAHLVDASMVESTLDPDPRYRMLDTIRTFGRDELERHGEDSAATDSFIRWALDLVVWIDRTATTHDEARADRRMRRELANLRAAWRICRDQDGLDDAVRMVIALTDVASWRDLTEVWTWALELAADAGLEAHQDAGFVLGLAAGSAWARGELDRADRLGNAGLQLGGGDWPCWAAAAMVALSRGSLSCAVELATRAAAVAERPDQSLGVAALAAAYGGDLDQGSVLAGALAAIATSPTLEGFSRYVSAEIHALAGRTDRAEEDYEQAVSLARRSGATFVDGISSVGLLTVRARAGRIGEALDGYLDLIEYWERTGGWTQQWTTLRNLARLLRTLDDPETALFLQAAADSAPDAPALHGVDDERAAAAVDPDRIVEIRRQAASVSRAGVLQAARQAIDRQRAARDGEVA